MTRQAHNRTYQKNLSLCPRFCNYYNRFDIYINKASSDRKQGKETWKIKFFNAQEEVFFFEKVPPTGTMIYIICYCETKKKN